jgi:hypothetical protein
MCRHMADLCVNIGSQMALAVCLDGAPNRV